MTETADARPARAGRLAIPRSRGAASGFLLVVLGAWGALAPFVGPYLNFAYTPAQAWTWTAARGWLEVLPGAVPAHLSFIPRNATVRRVARRARSLKRAVGR